MYWLRCGTKLNTDVGYDFPWKFYDGMDVRLQRITCGKQDRVAMGMGYFKHG
jgi:hypothetical protein